LTFLLPQMLSIKYSQVWLTIYAQLGTIAKQ
jgi:hypothetical protein